MEILLLNYVRFQFGGFRNLLPTSASFPLLPGAPRDFRADYDVSVCVSGEHGGGVNDQTKSVHTITITSTRSIWSLLLLGRLAGSRHMDQEFEFEPN